MKAKTYELLYDTQAQFNQAQGSSGNVTSVTPGVAYVVENANAKYNRDPSVLTIVYEVDDISEPTKLFNADAVKNNLKLVFIDKEEVPVSGLNNTYQFTSTGLHTVRYVYSKFDFTPGGGHNTTFQNCICIKFVILPRKIVKLLATSIFNGCTKMQAITYPETIENALMGNYAFSSCPSMERANFRNWDFLKCSWSRPHNISPLASSTNGGAYYLNGEIIKNVVVPSGVTSIGDSLFRNNRALETFQFNGTETRIGAGAFEKCTNLRDIVIPSSVTTIAEAAFYECTGLTGNLVIPNTTTSIGQGAFENCSGFTGLSLSENLTSIGQTAFKNCKGLAGCSVVVPSGVTTLTGNTFTGDALKNLTVYGDFYGPSFNTTIGDGTGTIEVYGNYKFCWSNGLNFKDIIIHGDFIHCGSNGQYGAAGYFLTGSRNVETFRCEGTYSGHTSSAGILDTYGGEPNLKFFEILGDCIGKLFYNTASVTIGIDTIIHFGYNGVITNKPKELRNEPSQERFDPLNRVLKFYVGDGSSEEHDQAILNQYLQDADWAEYASKLDIWYNYHGEYRQE